MLITRTSFISGLTRTEDIDITQEHLDDWNSGTIIQHAMPHLTADEREFIMSGCTAAEWEAIFGEEE